MPTVADLSFFLNEEFDAPLHDIGHAIAALDLDPRDEATPADAASLLIAITASAASGGPMEALTKYGALPLQAVSVRSVDGDSYRTVTLLAEDMPVKPGYGRDMAQLARSVHGLFQYLIDARTADKIAPGKIDIFAGGIGPTVTALIPFNEGENQVFAYAQREDVLSPAKPDAEAFRIVGTLQGAVFSAVAQFLKSNVRWEAIGHA